MIDTDIYLQEMLANLGDTPGAQGSPNLPTGEQFVVVGFLDRPGERYWVPKSGGIIPGSLSVFDEGTLTGGFSSTTQLDFRGLGVVAEGTGTNTANPGVAVTVTFAPQDLTIQFYSKIMMILILILDLHLTMVY